MKTIEWDFKNKNWPHIRGKYSPHELKKELKFWQEKSKRRKVIGKYLGGISTLLLVVIIALFGYYKDEIAQWGTPINNFRQNNWWWFFIPIVSLSIPIGLFWYVLFLDHWVSGESCSARINCLEWLIKEQDPAYQKEKKERQEYWNKFWQMRWNSGYYNKCRCSCSEPNEPYLPGLL